MAGHWFFGAVAAIYNEARKPTMAVSMVSSKAVTRTSGTAGGGDAAREDEAAVDAAGDAPVEAITVAGDAHVEAVIGDAPRAALRRLGCGVPCIGECTKPKPK